MSLAASSFTSELTLPGFFDFVGGSQVGNMTEFNSPGGLTVGNLSQSRLIQTDQVIEFRFAWDVTGIFAHALNQNFLWEIELFLEQYGPGEFVFPPNVGKTTLAYGSGTPALGNVVSFPGTGAPTSTTISIPAGTIPAGVYDVVAVIRLTHPAPASTPCFLAAFAEYGKIQFYQEH